MFCDPFQAVLRFWWLCSCVIWWLSHVLDTTLTLMVFLLKILCNLCPGWKCLVTSLRNCPAIFVLTLMLYGGLNYSATPLFFFFFFFFFLLVFLIDLSVFNGMVISTVFERGVGSGRGSFEYILNRQQGWDPLFNWDGDVFYDRWCVIRVGIDISGSVIGFPIWLLCSSLEVKGHIEVVDYFEVGLHRYLQSQILEDLDEFFPYPVSLSTGALFKNSQAVIAVESGAVDAEVFI